MRIVIDMQGVQNDSRFRGIGRYTSEFVKSFIHVANQHEIVLVLNSAFPDAIDALNAEFEGIVGRNNIRVWQPLTPASFANAGNIARRLVSEQIREAFIASLQPDLVLVTSLFEGCGDDVVTSIGSFIPLPVAVIMYDFIPHFYPDQYLGNQELKAWYSEKLDHLKKAQLLLAISDSSKKEAVEIFGANLSAVVTISSAVDLELFAQQGASKIELQSKFSITKPYLMYTGASDPRKNLSGLVKAFATLPVNLRNAYQLVLAGPVTNEDVKQLRQLMSSLKLRNDHALFLGRVSDTDLIGLYRHARACILPSWHEGFGLPVLEAMACGAPVIGSNLSSIPEAVGLEEALFDPHSIESMAYAIARVLQDEPFRQRLIEHGFSHCKKFSWDSVARRGLAAMEATFSARVKEDTLSIDSLVDKLIVQIGQTFSDYKANRGDLFMAADAVAANFPQSIKRGERIS